MIRKKKIRPLAVQNEKKKRVRGTKRKETVQDTRMPRYGGKGSGPSKKISDETAGEKGKTRCIFEEGREADGKRRDASGRFSLKKKGKKQIGKKVGSDFGNHLKRNGGLWGKEGAGGLLTGKKGGCLGFQIGGRKKERKRNRPFCLPLKKKRERLMSVPHGGKKKEPDKPHEEGKRSPAQSPVKGRSGHYPQLPKSSGEVQERGKEKTSAPYHYGKKEKASELQRKPDTCE